MIRPRSNEKHLIRQRIPEPKVIKKMWEGDARRPPSPELF